MLLASGLLAILGSGPVSVCPANPAGENITNVAFKGFELYSWKSAGMEFSYSLLIGTNRHKLESEIKSRACVLPDLEALKAALSRLPAGERVYWSVSSCPKKACAFPPASVKRDLASHAHKIGVALEPQ